MSHIARHLLIHGRVQGVNFRNACRRQARQLALRGWVRNLPDGAVEVHVQGPGEAVAELIDWAHHGPRNAHVSRVEIRPAQVQQTERFSVR